MVKIKKGERIVDISNLKVGNIYNNYKSICEALNEDSCGGNSKIAQLNEWERYFSFSKQGYKFIIDVIYDTPNEKEQVIGHNVAPYVEDTEILLIDLLLCKPKGEIKIPTTALLEVLKMVNYNYRKYYGNLRPMLSEELEIDIAYVDEYYEKVGSMLSGNIKTVIRRLKAKKLITYSEIVMVKRLKAVANEYADNGEIKIIPITRYDKNGIEYISYEPSGLKTVETYEEASVEERQKILRIQREAYLELEMSSDSNYYDLINKGKLQKYNELVKKGLMNMNIAFVFNSHHIIYNTDHLEAEREMLMNDIEKSLKVNNVNLEIRKRIIENGRKRMAKAEIDLYSYIDVIKGGYVQDTPENLTMRINGDYIENYKKLNSYLIDRNDKSVKNEV